MISGCSGELGFAAVFEAAIETRIAANPSSPLHPYSPDLNWSSVLLNSRLNVVRLP